MTIYNERLDDILIKEEYEKIEKYLKKINIKKEAKLKIAKGIKLPPEMNLYLFTVIPIILGSIYDYIDIIHASIASVIYIIPLFFKIWKARRAIAYYSSLTGSIYYKRESLEEKINRLLNTFYSSNIKIKKKGVIGVEITGDHIVLYPVYINKNKNKNNIKEIISKAVIDAIFSHEVSHLFFDSEKKASVLGFLLYYNVNKLLKHKKARKIIRENVKRCVEYVRNNKKYDDYSIGECYAIIDLYRNNFSIDTKQEIEKLKYMDDEDIIKEVKKYAKVPYRKYLGYFLKHEYNRSLAEKLYKYFFFF